MFPNLTHFDIPDNPDDGRCVGLRVPWSRGGDLLFRHPRHCGGRGGRPGSPHPRLHHYYALPPARLRRVGQETGTGCSETSQGGDNNNNNRLFVSNTYKLCINISALHIFHTYVLQYYNV